MSVTMLFGSFIAGATSEGGGAVAFPVMTLLFDIKPNVARDFSLLIQSFGMSAAAFTIIKNKIPIQKDVVFPILFFGIIGQILGFFFLDGFLSPKFLKISFTSIWLSFALVLFMQLKRKTHSNIKIRPSYLIYFFALIGGLITALTGSGIDILTFSIITLYYGVSEKVATPTSVLLMATLSITGTIVKFLFSDISSEAIDYWLVCAPIVIFGAPLGAIFITKRSKRFIIYFLQLSILVQFIFSWVILDLNTQLKLWSIFLVLIFSLCYYLIFRRSFKRD
ncbi:MAG: sulfite exporter TauE/SafE family protein [Oligoflexia bacterium]|nr:sulfite exporter TauE/SafE family protein [Oligoflexia bacterium]